MRALKLVVPTAILMSGFVVLTTASYGKPEYGKKEGKSCTFCHPAGKMKELTPAGQYYKDHNHSLEGYKAPTS